MFTSGFSEASQSHVPIHGFSEIALQAMLSFLYTGMINYPAVDRLKIEYLAPGGTINALDSAREQQIPGLKVSFLSEMLHAADYFSLPSLKVLCANMLYDLCDCTQNGKDFIHMLDVCDLYDLTAVREHCVYRLCTEHEEVLTDIPASSQAQKALHHLSRQGTKTFSCGPSTDKHCSSMCQVAKNSQLRQDLGKPHDCNSPTYSVSETESKGTQHEVNPKFIKQFLQDDGKVQDTANLHYELAPLAYADWEFQQELFAFTYPRFKFKLERCLLTESQASTHGTGIQQVCYTLCQFSWNI